MRRIIYRLMTVCMAVTVLATVLHAEEGAAHGKKVGAGAGHEKKMDPAQIEMRKLYMKRKNIKKALSAIQKKFRDDPEIAEALKVMQKTVADARETFKAKLNAKTAEDPKGKALLEEEKVLLTRMGELHEKIRKKGAKKQPEAREKTEAPKEKKRRGRD